MKLLMEIIITTITLTFSHVFKWNKFAPRIYFAIELKKVMEGVAFVGLVLFKVFSILKRNEKVISCFRTVCHQTQSPDDDWELYEQTALVRGEEAQQREEKGADCNEVNREHDECETKPQSVSLLTYGI